MPKRIQRKRTKGWRMPEGAVYVGRPTKWGNPFVVIRPRGCELWYVDDTTTHRQVEVFDDRETAARDATFRYQWWLNRHPDLDDIEAILGGKDLACWCPLDQPCHADVLLELANAEPAKIEA